MKISRTDNIYFGNKTSTVKLFESLIGKNFESENIQAYKTIYLDLDENKRFVGNIGYRGYVQTRILDKILEKYPNLRKDREIIQEYLKLHPNITKEELAEYMQTYINKYGKIIDINI